MEAAGEFIRCSHPSGCGELKPLSKMANVGARRDPLCHACHQRRRRAAQGTVEVRRANLWAKCRITPDEYDELRAAQGFRCAICQVHENDIDPSTVGGRPRMDGVPLIKFALAVDHCHDTGKVRGLLCSRCNAGLGMFRNRPDLLASATDYLQRSSE